jgi:iron(III) transport system substrate-binding protein
LGGAQGFKLIGDTINKKYGISLNYEWAPGAAMSAIAAKIMQEKEANQPASTDVYIGTDTHFGLLRAKQAMKTLDWPGLSEGRITPEIAVKDNAGVKIDSRFVGVPYNTNFVKGEDVPQQLSDLLKPKWKGKFASTPYAAEWPVLASPKMLGGEKTDAFMQQFVPYVSGLIRCGEEQRVASGEFAMMALDCGGDPTEDLQQRGAPIGHAILKDASIINMDRLGVPVNSAHPHAAALFILYLSTPEGQGLVFKLQHIDLHYYPESHQHQQLADLQAKGIKPFPATADNLAGFDQKVYQDKYTKLLATAAGK